MCARADVHFVQETVLRIAVEGPSAHLGTGIWSYGDYGYTSLFARSDRSAHSSNAVQKDLEWRLPFLLWLSECSEANLTASHGNGKLVETRTHHRCQVRMELRWVRPW